MDADCSCCGDVFQSENEEIDCLSCGDCSGTCSKSSESVMERPIDLPPPTPMIVNDSSCYSFPELESKLFEGENGKKTLARIITRMRVEGYDEDAWKVIIGLSAFAYKNYNCKNISIQEQLRMLESAPLRDITKYIPGDIDGLVNNVIHSENNFSASHKTDKDAYKIMALGLTALIFSYVSRR
jgi:hypothetical protein